MVYAFLDSATASGASTFLTL